MKRAETQSLLGRIQVCYTNLILCIVYYMYEGQSWTL